MKKSQLLTAVAVLVLAATLFACSSNPDCIASASTRLGASSEEGWTGAVPDAPLIVTPSPEGGAAKIASAIATKLGAGIISPLQLKPQDLADVPLIGFGSGIMDQMHHVALLDFAESLPHLPGRKVFIFSVSGVSLEFAIRNNTGDPHKALRERLVAKGCEIVGEFNCVGFNDNSFLAFFGGMNKGRPSQADLEKAEDFAASLETQAGLKV